MNRSCIIVDDEPVARQILKSYIEKIPGLEVAAEAGSGTEALAVLSKSKFDLVFLDINMPGLSGMEVARAIKGENIIFTTAYPEYAVEGFEVNAVDYLVKPIAFERFYEAIEKARDYYDLASSNFIWIKSEKKQHRVPLENILFVSSLGDYLKVHLQEETLVVHGTMKNFVSELPSDRFLRVHKSYLVALNHVRYLEGNRISIGDQMIPIGASYRDEVMKVFK